MEGRSNENTISKRKMRCGIRPRDRERRRGRPKEKRSGRTEGTTPRGRKGLQQVNLTKEVCSTRKKRKRGYVRTTKTKNPNHEQKRRKKDEASGRDQLTAHKITESSEKKHRFRWNCRKNKWDSIVTATAGKRTIGKSRNKKRECKRNPSGTR